MQIRHEYQATAAQVAAMLLDEEFLTQVAKEVGAASSNVTQIPGGAKLQAAVAAPSEARRFVGDTLTVNLELLLNPEQAAPISGQLRGDVERIPAKMTGSVVIAETGSGASATYDIDFSVAIPLVGRRLEQAAEPEVRQIVDVQERVGKRYLAQRS